MDGNASLLYENKPAYMMVTHKTWVSVVLSTVAGFICFVTIFGNLMVLLAFWIKRSIRKPSNYFLASLAVSDLFIGAFSMPLFLQYLYMHKWLLGRWVCDVWLTIDWTVCMTSQFTVLLITTDRFLSLKIPGKYSEWRTRRRALKVIAITWLLPFLICSVAILGWPYLVPEGRTVEDDECRVQFMDDGFFTILWCVGCYFFPMAVMCVLYVLIYRIALRLHHSLYQMNKSFTSTTTRGMMTFSLTATNLDPSPAMPTPQQKQQVTTRKSNSYTPPGRNAAAAQTSLLLKVPSEKRIDADKMHVSKSTLSTIHENVEAKPVLKQNVSRTTAKSNDSVASVKKPNDLTSTSLTSIESKTSVHRRSSRTSLRSSDSSTTLKRPSQTELQTTTAAQQKSSPSQKADVSQKVETSTGGQRRMSKPAVKRKGSDVSDKAPATVEQPDRTASSQKDDTSPKHQAAPSKTSGTRPSSNAQSKTKARTEKDYDPVTDSSQHVGSSQPAKLSPNSESKLAANTGSRQPSKSPPKPKTGESTAVVRRPSATQVTDPAKTSQNADLSKPKPVPFSSANTQTTAATNSKPSSTAATQDSPTRLQSTASTKSKSAEESRRLSKSSLTSEVTQTTGAKVPSPAKEQATATGEIKTTTDDHIPTATSEHDSKTTSQKQDHSPKRETGGFWSLFRSPSRASLSDATTDTYTHSQDSTETNANLLQTFFKTMSITKTPDSATPTTSLITDNTLSSDLGKADAVAAVDHTTLREAEDRADAHAQNVAGCSPIVACGQTCDNYIDQITAAVNNSRRSSLAASERLRNTAANAYHNLTEAAQLHKCLLLHRRRESDPRTIHTQRALRTISLIVGAFILCWTPFYVVSIAVAIGGYSAINDKLFIFTYWLCYINSPINPFIYAYVNADFRRTFIRIFKMRWSRA